MLNEKTKVVERPEETSLAPIRDYEELSVEEKAKVDKLMKKLIDYSDSSLIDFSADNASKSAKEAEDFLKNTKLNDLDEFNTCMGDLTKSLRSIDTQELSKQDPNPLSKIPIIGRALAKSAVGKKVESVIERQETIKKSVDMTIKTLEGIKLTLREDLIRCEKTREATIEFAKNLEYEYIALSKKKRELEKEYEAFIARPDYNPSNLDHSEYAEKLQAGIMFIEAKMDDELRYLVNAVQDVPSLATIKSAERAMVRSIDDCVKNVVPEWNKAFLKAILAYRVNNAAEVMKSTKEATNSILVKSSEMTSKALISAAEAIELPQIASETLEKKTEIFISTCNEIVRISIEASKRRAEDAVKLKELEKKSLIQNSQRKTVPSMLESAGGESNG